MDKVINFYEAILAAVDVHMDQSGDLYLDGGEDGKIAVPIADRVLVMPLTEVLSASPWDTKVAFNPIAESLSKGESPVLRRLRFLMMNRIATTMSVLVSNFIKLGASPKLHDALSPEQASVLKLMSKATDKTVSYWTRITRKFELTGDFKPVHLFIKKKGRIKRTSYNRVCTVEFPVAEEANNEDKKSIFGVTQNIADKTIVLDLLEFILPGCTNDAMETYGAGTNAVIAPNMVALLTAFYKVYSRLNEVMELYSDVIDCEGLIKDLTWFDTMDDVETFRDLIMVREGNDGDDLVVAKKENPAEAVSASEAPKRGLVLPPEPTRPDVRPESVTVNTNTQPTTSTGLPTAVAQQREQQQQQRNQQSSSGSYREWLERNNQAPQNNMGGFGGMGDPRNMGGFGNQGGFQGGFGGGGGFNNQPSFMGNNGFGGNRFGGGFGGGFNNDPRVGGWPRR